MRLAMWSIGMSSLLIAVAASAMLVRKHFGAMLPGCGPASGCDALERSPWSRVPIMLPGIGMMLWPVSFLGIAYFGAMTGAWAVSWRRVGVTLGGVATIGLLNSVVYSAVMAYLGTFCVYCSAAHGMNLVFSIAAWATILFDRRKMVTMQSSYKAVRFPTFVHRVWSGAARPGPVAFLAIFAMVSFGLGLANARMEGRRAASAEAERAKSVREIAGSDSIDNARVSSVVVEPPPVDRWGPKGFTGRYRKGAQEAAIRIVVLTDFQCPDCKRVEGEIDQAMAALNGPSGSGAVVSLSIKHFPMCKDCNTYVPQTIHGNACFAARAAEAAGILGGDEAFYKFVDWLFEVDGKFETTQILARGVERAGLAVDVNAFAAVMTSPETLKRVQADTEDGMALGLYYTPMVFINGVEMKGWQVPGSVTKSIVQLSRSEPALPAKSAFGDRPALAAQRFVDDWKEQTAARAMMDDLPEWSIGAKADYAPADTTKGPKLVQVIVFGDYTEPATAKLDAQLREAMGAEGTNVRYTFRHYPLNPECNPGLPPNVNKSVIRAASCLASRAVEAAGKLGGNEAYWRMHEWVMKNQKEVTAESLAKAAKEQGMDAGAFAEAMRSSEVESAIRDDAIAGQMAGLTSLPMVFVGGKQVPRPLRDGDNVIKRIIEEAGKP